MNEDRGSRSTSLDPSFTLLCSPPRRDGKPVYVNSFDSALARIAALGASNSGWAKFRSKAEGDARMAMLDLQAHLLLPVQRIPRHVWRGGAVARFFYFFFPLCIKIRVLVW